MERKIEEMTSEELGEVCSRHITCSRRCPFHDLGCGFRNPGIFMHSVSLSEPEKALLRALDVAYVSKGWGYENTEVELWNHAPVEHMRRPNEWAFNGKPLGRLPAYMFPSMEQGTFWDVKKILEVE